MCCSRRRGAVPSSASARASASASTDTSTSAPAHGRCRVSRSQACTKYIKMYYSLSSGAGEGSSISIRTIITLTSCKRCHGTTRTNTVQYSTLHCTTLHYTVGWAAPRTRHPHTPRSKACRACRYRARAPSCALVPPQARGFEERARRGRGLCLLIASAEAPHRT